MEQKTLSAEPRRSFSNEFKLQMVKLASQPGASVARIAREHDINITCPRVNGKILRTPATVSSE
ncbi:transposase [Salmonella enterica]|nr:transposase [Salmonella enterica]